MAGSNPYLAGYESLVRQQQPPRVGAGADPGAFGVSGGTARTAGAAVTTEAPLPSVPAPLMHPSGYTSYFTSSGAGGQQGGGGSNVDILLSAGGASGGAGPPQGTVHITATPGSGATSQPAVEITFSGQQVTGG